MPSQFLTPLQLEPLDDGRRWRLLSQFEYHVGALGSSDRIAVPIDFITDFASVPRPLWALLPPWGRYGKAVVLHDWLYADQSRKRKAADLILLEAMEVLGVGKLTRLAIYSGVRVGGWLAWRKHTQRKNNHLEQ